MCVVLLKYWSIPNFHSAKQGHVLLEQESMSAISHGHSVYVHDHNVIVLKSNWISTSTLSIVFSAHLNAILSVRCLMVVVYFLSDYTSCWLHVSIHPFLWRADHGVVEVCLVKEAHPHLFSSTCRRGLLPGWDSSRVWWKWSSYAKVIYVHKNVCLWSTNLDVLHLIKMAAITFLHLYILVSKIYYFSKNYNILINSEPVSLSSMGCDLRCLFFPSFLMVFSILLLLPC